MSLERAIVAWIKDRAPWQQGILRRIARGDPLGDSEYDRLLDDLVSARDLPPVDFGLEHLPSSTGSDQSVRLVSISDLQHVNALASNEPLTFGATGLTVVYGDNGSGKSGYARLLKRIARARHREEILSDVFRDTAAASPSAALQVRIGEQERSLKWPDENPGELKRMLFYDDACGSAYVNTESDFPYRPSAFLVLDGLIEVCLAIRAKADERIEMNVKSQRATPEVDESVRDTAIGRFLGGLSGGSSLEEIDAILTKAAASGSTPDGLAAQEASLLSADTTRERQRLGRQSAKLEAVADHLDRLEQILGSDNASRLQERRAGLRTLRDAADLAARSFDEEPLPGVGTPPWKALWESARRFSESHAYEDRPFPVVDDSLCVLCQQPISAVASARLLRFEQFVLNDTQTRLHAARGDWEEQMASLANLSATADSIESHLADVEGEHASTVRDAREALQRYETTRIGILAALSGSEDLPRASPPNAVVTQLRVAAADARRSAEALASPEDVADLVAKVRVMRKELELLLESRAHRDVIEAEIKRLAEHGALTAAKAAAATGPITAKVVDLSEMNITAVVRDAFTRESDRLGLERVTMTKTRGERGSVLHQPKLVGARQPASLPKVFSEGERTALGLAGFFTEARLDTSDSALVLDDPVSSLDHIRRGRVAIRLAEFAVQRQVAVFTHDVSFVADLKREAAALGAPVTERSVTRERGGERKPGTCTPKHPWKAKDVKDRIGELRTTLDQIKRGQTVWDEQTYEDEVAIWAGNLSETWERAISQEVVGPVLAEGGLEVRPAMVRVLAQFTDVDCREFEASYRRVSQWAKRHDKSGLVNYVPPEADDLEREFTLVDSWFKRVRAYKK